MNAWTRDLLGPVMSDLVDAVAAGMAGPVFRARVNAGCRTCPVASCCPVHPDGAQLGP